MRDNILSINKLWKDEKCPLVDGVIFDDGTVIEFDIKYSSLGSLIFEEKRKTNLMQLSKEEVDNYKYLYHSKTQKTQGTCKYMVGEGSWGGDGYLACLDLKTNKLLWIFTSDKINPIVDLDFLDDKVIIKNNNKSIFSVEVNYLDKHVFIIEELESDIIK